ncbi:BamA/OMP85 family outer membrane protein [Roseisolibacter agri]|uniref:Outer membrane protein assembly factor BamA n=1 Tax=Roseisolibacter agri TaxID=2014610 RepID=A0AA37VD44_9BACT|nr:BamA/TamA family outer membrane protein [Roseisolibacter agri]GLC28438.1 outer membrane protein assembly factor BamA [Roseisolibacter agri]
MSVVRTARLLTRRLARLAVACLLGAAAAPAVHAQDVACEAGDREVRALRFEGNRAFSDVELGLVVVTTPSSVVSRLRIVGTRRCLDPDEFPRDLLRLQAYYRRRGYPKAEVDTTVRAVAPNAVAVTFRITEGAPLRLESLTIAGLDSVRDGARLARDFPLRRGGVFDRNLLEAGRDSIIARLRDTGYPAADALPEWTTDLATMTATATLRFVPGPFTRLGRITVQADTTGGRLPRIPEPVVRRTLGLRTGDPFSAADIVEAQRTLYQTDAYRRVEIRVDTAAGVPDSVANLIVTVTEGDLRAARVSAGWATLDCFRTQGDLTSYYFLPRAQRLELTGRVSRIGIGDPLDGAEDLCPQAKNDLYSDKLNYYLGATIRQPRLFRLRRVPSLTLFTSRQSEYNAFRRTTSVGALFSVASRAGSRLPSTFTYQLELGSTEANAAVFCAVFSACDRDAREFLARRVPLGALGYSLVRDRTNDPLNPTSGTQQRLSLRHSSAFTGSDRSQRFSKATLDATWYQRLGGAGSGSLLIAHVQGGALFGGAPPQERLFAGGPTTVRGFRQNELGPVVYLVQRFDTLTAPVTGEVTYFADPAEVPVERTIPVGGNSLVVGNLEAQLRSPVLPQLLSLALFTDAGAVWDRKVRTADIQGRLRFTPGAGVRIRSPFGAIRVDLGYNPYDPIGGAAYYVTEPRDRANGTSQQELYCVAPPNQLLVRPTRPGDAYPVQEPGSCPADFRPRAPSGFLKRLNPSIWIGQAF